jgi:ribosome-binding protein aMBF1 (putative translation factor)
MKELKLTPFEVILDEHYGKKGTSKRDDFEQRVEEAVHAYRIGEAIKKARLERNMTQEELGERIGVKKSQISRLERGYSITIPTMGRVFRALGIATATLDLGSVGKIALW